MNKKINPYIEWLNTTNQLCGEVVKEMIKINFSKTVTNKIKKEDINTIKKICTPKQWEEINKGYQKFIESFDIKVTDENKLYAVSKNETTKNLH